MKKKFLSMVLASGLALTGVFGSVPSVYADTNVGHIKEVKDEVVFSDDFENGISSEWHYNPNAIKRVKGMNGHCLEMNSGAILGLPLYLDPNAKYELIFDSALPDSVFDDFIRLTISTESGANDYEFFNEDTKRHKISFITSNLGIAYLNFVKYNINSAKGYLDNVVVKKVISE